MTILACTPRVPQVNKREEECRYAMRNRCECVNANESVSFYQVKLSSTKSTTVPWP